MKHLSILLVIVFALSSCMTTKTPVGSYKMQQGKEKVYAKGKQTWLFWGLIPLGRTSVATPPDGNCMVRTRYNFWDAFVSTLTAGIFSMTSIRVYYKPQNNTSENDSQITIQDGQVALNE